MTFRVTSNYSGGATVPDIDWASAIKSDGAIRERPFHLRQLDDRGVHIISAGATLAEVDQLLIDLSEARASLLEAQEAAKLAKQLPTIPGFYVHPRWVHDEMTTPEVYVLERSRGWFRTSLDIAPKRDAVLARDVALAMSNWGGFARLTAVEI